MDRLAGITRFVLAAALMCALLSSGAALAANPGEAGVLSLRLGVGAREGAMGETGVASSTGAAAVFWNPANNVFADFETEIVLQHYSYLSTFKHESAAVAHKMGSGVIGFMFTGFYSDAIDRYSEEPVGVPEGSFKPYDVSFGLSYAHPLGDNFGLGMNAKMIYEKIDLYSDSGFAFDFFLTHRAMIEGLTFAMSATNLGGQMNLKDEPFDLPTAFRVGGAYQPGGVLQGKLVVTGDLLFPNDTTDKAHVGAEYRLIPELALRAGTRINYEAQGWTAGVGFQVGRLGVDYAYEETKIQGFDDGHKFSLNLTW